MKTVITTFTLLNLAIMATYLYGVDTNRFICLVLWFVAPIANIIAYQILQERIWNNI